MGKKKVRQESVVKEAKRIWMHVQKNLRDGEKMVDLAWRPTGTAMGPPGWSFALTCENASGKNPTQGFAFGPNPPTIQAVEQGVGVVQKALDSDIVKSQIIIPQGKIIT